MCDASLQSPGLPEGSWAHPLRAGRPPPLRQQGQCCKALAMPRGGRDAALVSRLFRYLGNLPEIRLSPSLSVRLSLTRAHSPTPSSSWLSPILVAPTLGVLSGPAPCSCACVISQLAQPRRAGRPSPRQPGWSLSYCSQFPFQLSFPLMRIFFRLN